MEGKTILCESCPLFHKFWKSLSSQQDIPACLKEPIGAQFLVFAKSVPGRGNSTRKTFREERAGLASGKEGKGYD